jgi:hypothetical protein
LLEEAACALHAMPAEPAEELLGSVADEERAENETGEKEAGVHVFLL